jgi:uncharacterized C2H2 Zn-finger protein
MTTVPFVEMLRCENCPFETKSIIGLSRHVKQKHGLILSTAKNTCSFCKKVFSSSASCTRHVTTKVCIPEIEPTSTPVKEENIINISQSHPIVVEEPQFTKNDRPRVPTFVKVIICSMFFIPIYQRILKK